MRRLVALSALTAALCLPATVGAHQPERATDDPLLALAKSTRRHVVPPPIGPGPLTRREAHTAILDWSRRLGAGATRFVKCRRDTPLRMRCVIREWSWETPDGYWVASDVWSVVRAVKRGRTIRVRFLDFVWEGCTVWGRCPR